VQAGGQHHGVKLAFASALRFVRRMSSQSLVELQLKGLNHEVGLEVLLFTSCDVPRIIWRASISFRDEGWALSTPDLSRAAVGAAAHRARHLIALTLAMRRGKLIIADKSSINGP